MKDLQFGGNMYIVLVYDISQSEAGQKRWSRIFKICKKYLSHIQNSVLWVNIETSADAVEKGNAAVHKEELDSLLFLKAGRKNGWIKNFGQRRMIKQVLCYNRW